MSSEERFRIAIWGVGLIGGSLGMAWRRSGVALEVIGIGRQPLDEAVRLGAIDRYVLDPAEGLRVADVVVLCAPVCTIIDQAEAYGHFVKPGAVVTDVGSTKESIVAAWEKHLPPGASFVGAHPMFGREVTGVQHAAPDLSQGCPYILTPGDRATPEAIATVQRLAEAAGGVVRTMTPTQHDERIAVASHLPQLIATALAAAALEGDERLGGVLDLTAGGFRDTTRIAGSPSHLWTDILLTNQQAIRGALLLFRQSLDALESALDWNDPQAIARMFDRAHEARRRVR